MSKIAVDARNNPRTPRSTGRRKFRRSLSFSGQPSRLHHISTYSRSCGYQKPEHKASAWRRRLASCPRGGKDARDGEFGCHGNGDVTRVSTRYFVKPVAPRVHRFQFMICAGRKGRLRSRPSVGPLILAGRAPRAGALVACSSKWTLYGRYFSSLNPKRKLAYHLPRRLEPYVCFDTKTGHCTTRKSHPFGGSFRGDKAVPLRCLGPEHVSNLIAWPKSFILPDLTGPHPMAR